MPIFTSACPRNCYGTCSLRVQVTDGRVTGLEAHPGNLATPAGPCLKGLSYLEADPQRLLRPHRRRADGGFAPVSWDEALDLMAERLLDLRRRLGPRSVFYYAGSGSKGLLNGAGMAFWRLFGGCTTSYGDLCWPAGLEATRLTLGDNRHNAPWDLANARMIVFWGKNPAATNQHQMLFLEQALERGARCVVIDPRRTETAERAHLLVQPRPGSDGALALGLAHLIIAQGLTDPAFIRDHVLGFEAFARCAAAWTPERTAAVTGVACEHLRALARDLGTLRPVTICAGFGMQRYSNGGQTLRALMALLAITGNLGRPGAGWVYANLQTDLFGPVKDPLACYPAPDPLVRCSVAAARLGRDMAAQDGPPLQAAWVERGNPLTQNPDTARVREAFRALAFRVVVDSRLTDTALEADLVLPAKSLFEQTDVIGAYWHPYIQIRQKVVEPPPEVKPETEIYWLLARRMGLPTETLVAPGDEAVERCGPSRGSPWSACGKGRHWPPAPRRWPSPTGSSPPRRAGSSCGRRRRPGAGGWTPCRSTGRPGRPRSRDKRGLCCSCSRPTTRTASTASSSSTRASPRWTPGRGWPWPRRTPRPGGSAPATGCGWPTPGASWRSPRGSTWASARAAWWPATATAAGRAGR